MSDMEPRSPEVALARTGENALGAAVHDLTNAIAVLKVRLVLLQREALAPTQVRHVDALQRAVERANSSLDRLRTLHANLPVPDEPGRA